MPCYYPVNIPHPKLGTPITVPCGRCIGCRIERSRQWAVRIMHESKLHDENSFLTLTYDDQNLPPDRTLVKAHTQNFIKRLRKKISPKKISFFAVGEYGEDTQRPHYHIIIFGYDFPDKKYLKKSPAGEELFCSKILDSLWDFGWANIGQVTFDSAAYCAKYCVDKLNGELAVQEYDQTGRIAPYMTCSTRPAIGKRWLEKFYSDVFPHDEVISNGHPAKPPRYYDKILTDLDPDLALRITRERREKSEKNPDHNNYERLAVKHTVKKSQLDRMKKSL